VSINVAFALARAGKKVLLLDVDPQGSVGLSLTRQSRKLLGFFDYLSTPSLPMQSVIVPTRMGTMSIVAAGRDSVAEVEHAGSPQSVRRAQQFFVEAAALGYDYCVVDTAAGLFGMSAEIVKCADAVMLPQQAEPLGIRSVPKMLESLMKLRQHNPKLKVLGVLLTMVQRYLDESVASVQGLRDLLPPELVFNTEVPRDDVFIKASAKGLPIGVMPEGAELGQIFDFIAQEIEAKVAERESVTL